MVPTLAEFVVDQYRPPLGQLATVVLAVAGVGAMLWLYLFRQPDGSAWLRAVLVVLRTVAVAALVWILYGPSTQWSREIIRRRVPLLILADTSASMGHVDVTNPAPLEGEDPQEPISRWEALRRTWLDPEYQGRLEHLADVRLYAFDQSLRRIGLQQIRELSPDGAHTHLYTSLAQAIDAESVEESGSLKPVVTLLLSDGHDTEGKGDALTTSHLGGQWRVMAVPVGLTRGISDVSVNAWADADFLMEEQATWINAVVEHVGFEQRQVRVVLLHEGRLVESKTIETGKQSSQQVRFRVQPPALRSGTQITGYRVEAGLVPLVVGKVEAPGETYLENNSRWVFLQVSADRIKVAIFEAEPYWDTKFLVRVLRSDPSIALTSVYALTSGRLVTVRSNKHSARRGDELTERRYDPKWLRPATLNEFDVVILGKRAERFFGGHRAQWLVDYVRQQGGALVLARGRAFSTNNLAGREAQHTLSAIEPVEWGRGTVRKLQLQLTPQGRQSPLLNLGQTGKADAILTELPDMLAATRVDRERAASIVLLRQAVVAGGAGGASESVPTMAAVAHRNDGAGRVMAVLTDGLWQWSFLPSSLASHHSVYHDFWQRTIRWLATGGQFLPGQSISMAPSRLAVEPGESVQITVTTRYVESEQFQPSLVLVGPDGQREQLTLMRVSERPTRLLATAHMQMPGLHQFELSAVLRSRGDSPAPGSVPESAEPMRQTARVAVYESSEEKRDPSAKPQLLGALCEPTGGECLSLQQRDQLLAHLQALWQVRETDRKWNYVFDQPMVLALIGGFFGLEWFLRRRSVML